MDLIYNSLTVSCDKYVLPCGTHDVVMTCINFHRQVSNLIVFYFILIADNGSRV